MTGDDHGNNGTEGRFDIYNDRRAPRDAASANGSACAAPPTSIRRRRSARRSPPRSWRRVSKSACTSRPTVVTTRPSSLEANYASDLAEFADDLPEPAGAADQPHALHSRGATTTRSRRSPWRTASGWTPTTTTGRRVGERRPRPVHRIGHADALRQGRRHADRCLPGADADDRRIRPDASRTRSTRCSTGRSVPRATTARLSPTCTPTRANSPGSSAIVTSAQLRGVPIVSAQQMLDVARRPQRLHASPTSAGTAPICRSPSSPASGAMAFRPCFPPPSTVTR